MGMIKITIATLRIYLVIISKINSTDVGDDNILNKLDNDKLIGVEKNCKCYDYDCKKKNV